MTTIIALILHERKRLFLQSFNVSGWKRLGAHSRNFKKKSQTCPLSFKSIVAVICQQHLSLSLLFSRCGYILQIRCTTPIEIYFCYDIMVSSSSSDMISNDELESCRGLLSSQSSSASKNSDSFPDSSRSSFITSAWLGRANSSPTPNSSFWME